MKSGFLFNIYRNVFLQLNKGSLIFICELNSFNSSVLRSLKKDLGRSNFLMKNIKTRLLRKSLTEGSFKELISGPLFLLYNPSLNEEKDLKILRELYDHNFILGNIFYNKFYLFSKLQSFKKLSLKNQFFSTIVSIVNLLSLYNYSYLNKIRLSNC